jgi:rhomboid family protein
VFPIKDNIPTDRFPVVTLSLVVANVLVYFLFQKGGIRGVDTGNVVQYGLIPYEVTHPGQHCAISGSELVCSKGIDSQPDTVVTIFSSMFMHGGILHLGGNMLFLWIFGNNVEDAMGPVRFLVFYLLGGLAAVAGQVIVGPNEATPLIGASGAVAAVLGGYIVLYPRARVLTIVFIIFFFTILELPAMLMLGLWFVEQILFGAYGLVQPVGQGGGVAYFAHIGGFALGLVLVHVFATRRSQHYELVR